MMSRAPAPVATATTPIRALPAGACDAHVHMVADDYALWEGRVEDPAPGEFTHWINALRGQMNVLGMHRTVIVHSILYGPDNSVTLDAVQALGPDNARAITLVPDDVDEATLDAHSAAGSAGVRLNYVHGGLLSWAGACAMAPQLAARGMHIQMLLHSHLHMAEIAADIRALPVPVVVDHIGWPDLTLGLDDLGFQTLLELLAEGHIYIKLSAPYRLDGDVLPFIGRLLQTNPERCLWGSDWPHLMLNGAALPDAGALLNELLGMASVAQTQAVFVDNPKRLFGF